LYYRLKQGGLPAIDPRVARFIGKNPACDADALATKMAKDSHVMVGCAHALIAMGLVHDVLTCFCLTHTPQGIDELKRLHLPWRYKQHKGSRAERFRELAAFFLQHRHLYNLSAKPARA
jgi:hypothetical protein